jgi:hypothetical protein
MVGQLEQASTISSPSAAADMTLASIVPSRFYTTDIGGLFYTHFDKVNDRFEEELSYATSVLGARSYQRPSSS